MLTEIICRKFVKATMIARSRPGLDVLLIFLDDILELVSHMLSCSSWKFCEVTWVDLLWYFVEGMEPVRDIGIVVVFHNHSDK